MTKKELLLDIPREIESERLIIKRYEKGQGKNLFELLERNDNREFLKEHVDEATTVHTLEDAEIRVRELHEFWITRKHFVMGIWLKETNTYIGNIWIQPLISGKIPLSNLVIFLIRVIPAWVMLQKLQYELCNLFLRIYKQLKFFSLLEIQMFVVIN